MDAFHATNMTLSIQFEGSNRTIKIKNLLEVLEWCPAIRQTPAPE